MLVTFSVTEAELIFEPAGIVERFHLRREYASLPLPAGSSPSAHKAVEAPYLVVAAFSRILVSAILVTVAVLALATVQLRLAGVASTLAAASMALTVKVCDPSVRLL